MYVSMYVCTIALTVIVALVLHLKDSVNVCRDLQRWLVGSLYLPERQKLRPSCSSIDCLLFFVASVAVQNFLVAVVAVAADAHIAAIGAALVAAVAAAATAFAAAVTAGLLGMFFGPARATQPCWYWQW